MQAKKLEERWTPTTIHATFALPDLPSHIATTSRGISVHLPLLNLGWTFTLSLAPERFEAGKKKIGGSVIKKGSKLYKCQWVPSIFSFRRDDSKIPWGNTSMHAQLSLEHDCDDSALSEEECTPHASDLIGTIKVVLGCTPSAEYPLPTSCKLSSSHQPTRVWLTVTIQQCPFPDGLFQASSNHGSETEAQTQLARQSGDRVLSRSLATGKLFDVKFLSFSTRLTSGNTGKLLPTYASLSVLEKHVNLPDGK